MATETRSTTGGAPGTAPQPDPLPSSQPPSQRPVEMTELEAAATTAADGSHDLDGVDIPNTSPLTSLFPPPADGQVARGNAGPQPSSSPAETSTDALSSSAKEPAATASDPVPASSPPSTDAIGVVAAEKEGPVLVITLLLTSGARHPYKIDEKYLAKRNVAVPGTTENGRKDPFSISVYTLKELILREWREEWEAQPSSPSSIRLIYFGRLLDDKAGLKDCRFNTEGTNVIHMTVRPQDIVDEEDASKGKSLGRDRDGGEGTAGCRCVIL